MKRLLLFLFLLFIFYPLIIGLLTSLSYNIEVVNGFNTTPIKIEYFTFDNYKSFFANSSILIPIAYTAIISLISSIIILFVSFILSYYLSRYNNRFFIPFLLVLFVYSVPSIYYATYWNNTPNSLVQISVQFILSHFNYLFPFALLLTVNYFSYVPFSFDRQSAMDGISSKYFITRIIFPYFKPVIFTLFLIVFVIIFNDVLFSTFIAKSEEYRFIGHYIIENIYNQEDINRYAEISVYGIAISIVLIIISYVVLTNYHKYIKNELKNNI